MQLSNAQTRGPPSRQSHSHSTSNKHQSTTPPKLNYRGITLKEYFRITQEGNSFNEVIQEAEEEEHPSSKESGHVTPSFSFQKGRKLQRPKIKTQVNEEQVENHCKNNVIRGALLQGDPAVRSKISSIVIDNIQKKDNPFKRKERDDKRKNAAKAHSNSRLHADLHNRSTLSSFYQGEQNRKRMLRKLKAEKQRVNELRLSQAFFITKYGSRFNIDKQIVK